MHSAQPLQRFIVPVIFVSSIVVAALSFLIPTVPQVADPLSAHLRTAWAIMIAVLYTGSAFWLLGGLQTFKKSLQVAYRTLAIGVIAFSFSLLQLPVIGLFDLWETAWADSGGAIVPFVIATLLIYLGMRKFARILQIPTAWTRLPLFFCASIGFTILSWFAAEAFLQYELEGASIYIAVVGWTVINISLAALLAHKITGAIGQSYHAAMLWLEVALVAVSLAGLHEYLTTFFMNNGHPYEDYGIYLWPFAVSGALFVRAAYEFRLLSPEQTAAAPPSRAALQDHDYVESIIAIAGLASRREEVDSILDDLRITTARIEPNAKITDKDKQKLLTIYYRLESYLMNNDPLRSFSQSQLRQHLKPAFIAVLEQSGGVRPGK